MSADKPEVGDVWQRKLLFDRVHIVQVSKNAVRYQIGKIKFKTIPKDFFLDAYKYLGKSKASIRDLFCVKENAENVVQTDLRNIDDMQKKIEFAKEAVDLFFKTEDESKLLEIAEWE